MNVQTVLPRDSIPSIDEPTFDAEYFGDPTDDVIVVDGGPPRAYPIRILSYHEIVNDIVDGRAIAVTWCPICWSAVVYDRTVDGRTLTFGVSGKLADDALVMYDRETGSEWKQPTGTAIAGTLAGTRLEALASPIVSWERFRTDHPEGIVLQPVRGNDEGFAPSPRELYAMRPYERYVHSDAFGLFGMRGTGAPRSWDRDDLDAKSVVLGIESDGVAVGYPIQRVEAEEGIVIDTVGDMAVVVFTSEGGIHAFEQAGYDFRRRSEAIHADGATWDPVTGKSSDGRKLPRVRGRRMFAFAWQDAHGADAFYAS